MPSESLLPASSLVSESAFLCRVAAQHLSAGQLDDARRIIAGLDDAGLRRHWDDVHAEPARRAAPAIGSTGERRHEFGVSDSQSTALFQRDGWHCRWCRTPVISPAALRRIHESFPAEFPRDATNNGRHGLILAASASVDHVLPLGRGGTNDIANLVTACWPCQFARGSWTLGEVGLSDPRLRESVAGDWDGIAFLAG